MNIVMDQMSLITKNIVKKMKFCQRNVSDIFYSTLILCLFVCVEFVDGVFVCKAKIKLKIYELLFRTGVVINLFIEATRAKSSRSRASWQQRTLLERVFQHNQYPDQNERAQLAKELGRIFCQ